MNFETVSIEDLPTHLFLSLKNGSRISVKKFLQNKKYKMEDVSGIVNLKRKKYIIKIDFPINLINFDYVRLYSLMLAEGSKTTEFRLHVPEKELHFIFKQSIKNLFPKTNMENLLSMGKSHNISRSNAPSILRFIIPIPNEIPNFIQANKEFSKEFIKIFFESEGTVVKNRIKLTQSIPIELKIARLKTKNRRIFLGEIKRKKNLFKKIKSFEPKILLDIQKMLEQHFNINSLIRFESIRINKTARKGKITAKWVISITSKNISKFYDKIGLLTDSKNQKLRKVANSPKRNIDFFALEIMKKLSKRKNYFSFREFIEAMKKEGYVYASVYLWRYQKSKFITKLSRGKYKVNNYLGTSSAFKTSK